MEILGIGPLEFALIILVALIVLGPRDMVKVGRTLGRFLRKIVTSSEWRTVQNVSRELRYLPNKLIREAGLEDAEKEIREIGGQLKDSFSKETVDFSSWTSVVDNIPPTPSNKSPTTDADLSSPTEEPKPD